MEDLEKKLLTDLYNFTEGYLNILSSSLELQTVSFDEQVEYRKSICGDCIETGKCKHCGCKVPARLYSTKTCNNGERFPDIMSSEEWQQFKDEKNN